MLTRKLVRAEVEIAKMVFDVPDKSEFDHKISALASERDASQAKLESVEAECKALRQTNQHLLAKISDLSCSLDRAFADLNKVQTLADLNKVQKARLEAHQEDV